MKYFYDGADPEEFRDILNKGIISGITTNINFVVDYASKRSFSSYFDAIFPLYELACSTNKCLPFLSKQLEVVEELISSAIQIKSKFNDGIKLYIKIPVNYNNLYAINYLANKENININATCITSFLQATAACSCGASILSFFWGK